MAKQRVVNTYFWNDPFIMKLRADEKLLFLYALTNPQTDLCGAYELAMEKIVFETRLTERKVIEIFAKFEEAGKICYRNGWVLIKNFAKHQQGNSPNVAKGAARSLNLCPDWVKQTLLNGLGSVRKEIALLPIPIGITSGENLTEQPEPLEAEAAAKIDPVERRIWKDGIDLLKQNGMTETNARPLLGRLAKQYSSPTLAEAIAVTQAKNPADPKAFLIGVLKERSGENGRIKSQVGRNDPALVIGPEPPCETCGAECCMKDHSG